jgi:hypothetical protein
MLAFDIAGPLLAYRLVRDNSGGTVTALLVASAIPLLGVILTAIRERHLDPLGLIVMIGTGAGGLLSVLVDSPRPTLLFTTVLPTFAFGIGCLVSLRRTPLLYSIALAFVGGPDSPKGKGFAADWRDHAGFRRYFRNVTLAWGLTYLVESAAKTAIIARSSTGTSLALAGTLSTVVTALLIVGMLVYARIAQRR